MRTEDETLDIQSLLERVLLEIRIMRDENSQLLRKAQELSDRCLALERGEQRNPSPLPPNRETKQ